MADADYTGRKTCARCAHSRGLSEYSHMCGRSTPRELRGTHYPAAPELDHIVSLADGGSHACWNVACACRSCNSKKGARSFGQLGLPLVA